MAVANDAPTTKPVNCRNVDLKWSLTVRVVAVAVACFVFAGAFALYGTYRELRQDQEKVADIVLKQLQAQLFRIESNIDVLARFPDWDPVVGLVQDAGQCIQYIRPDGRVGRSSCMGVDGSRVRFPAWLSSLGAWMLGPRAEIAHPISYNAKTYGTLVVSTETDVVLSAIVREVSRLLGLTALLVAAICLLQYAAISRALRPTREILIGLDRLAQGELSCRLPNFRLIELQRISEVFNTLAKSLDQSTRERTVLAARLVDAQEQERRHLAQELHDELAQMLSAVTAGAASIRATAETQCPALVSEAETLSETAMGVMRSLRTTLQTLRPPEIDDFGLAASLTALARDQERLSGGKLKVSLAVDDDLHGLPPTAAGHVYRIVQEGLTNIIKHADAQVAHVTLELLHAPPETAARPSQALALTIQDDGCGAAENRIAAGGGRLGLIGMRERALALGGQLEVVQLDGGFKLRAVIPFDGSAEKRQ